MMRELAAKTELIEFLRAEGLLSRGSTIVLELAVENMSNRVDLSIIDDKVHHFEVKTSFDNLSRLDDQVFSYLKCGDFVTVLAATKHVSAVMSRVPEEVGIFELVNFDADNKIRILRSARPSKKIEKCALLRTLPVVEIRNRLLKGIGPLRRRDVDQKTSVIGIEAVRDAFIAFLHDRYGSNSKAFFRRLRKRRVRPADLKLLRIWERDEGEEIPQEMLSVDHRVYQAIGSSFGPVPNDIRKGLKG